MLSILSTVVVLAPLAQFALADNDTTSDILAYDYDAYNNAEFGKIPVHSYVTNNDRTPLLQVNDWDKNRTDSASHIFLRHSDDGDESPLILSAEDLSVVYVNRSYDNVLDVRIQQNDGEDYLTFWAGDIDVGWGRGRCLAFDNTYSLAYNVSTVDLTVESDIHEFRFTGNGTALVVAYEPYEFDTEIWGGQQDGRLFDAVFQEVDLETNELLFTWRASEHVDPGNSYQDYPERDGDDDDDEDDNDDDENDIDDSDLWDYFHINSVERVCHTLCSSLSS